MNIELLEAAFEQVLQLLPRSDLGDHLASTQQGPLSDQSQFKGEYRSGSAAPVTRALVLMLELCARPQVWVGGWVCRWGWWGCRCGCGYGCEWVWVWVWVWVGCVSVTLRVGWSGGGGGVLRVAVCMGVLEWVGVSGWVGEGSCGGASAYVLL